MGAFLPPSFQDRIIRQDMRPMPHAVRLGELLYHSAGYAGGKAVRGNIPCDHAAGADDTIVPDRHPGQTVTEAPNQQSFPICTGLA